VLLPYSYISTNVLLPLSMLHFVVLQACVPLLCFDCSLDQGIVLCDALPCLCTYVALTHPICCLFQVCCFAADPSPRVCHTSVSVVGLSQVCARRCAPQTLVQAQGSTSLACLLRAQHAFQPDCCSHAGCSVPWLRIWLESSLPVCSAQL